MLKFIKEVDLGSGVRKASATDIFTSDYDVYFVTVTDLTSSYSIFTWSHAYFLNTSGTDITNANYSNSLYQSLTYTTPAGESVYTGQTKINLAFGADANPEANALSFWVYNPMNSNSYTYASSKILVSNTVNQGIFAQGMIELRETTQVAGMSFEHNFADQVLDSGTLRCYGLE